MIYIWLVWVFFFKKKYFGNNKNPFQASHVKIWPGTEFPPTFFVPGLVRLLFLFLWGEKTEPTHSVGRQVSHSLGLALCYPQTSAVSAETHGPVGWKWDINQTSSSLVILSRMRIWIVPSEKKCAYILRNYTVKEPFVRDIMTIRHDFFWDFTRLFTAYETR